MTALRFALLAVLVSGCMDRDVYLAIPGDVPSGEEPCEGIGGPILAGGEDVPAGVAIDADYVYWVTYTVPGTVRAVSKCGGTPVTLATAGYMPRAILVDDTNLYWGDGGTPATLRAMPKSGGTITELATSGGTIDFLAQDATNIYWTDWHDDEVRAVPKSGGATVSLVTNAGNAFGAAVDDAYVYWSDYDTGGVFRAPKTGGAAELLATAPYVTWSVAVDSANVYWAANGTNELWSVPKTGGAPSLLVSGWNFRGLTTWDGAVYWLQYGYTDPGLAAVGASDTSGTAIFATGNTGPWGIAVDDTGIYYTSMNEGLVVHL